MVYRRALFSFLLMFFLASTLHAQTLRLGNKVPAITQKMEDISGRSTSLGEVADQNGLLVIFTCNTCPQVMRWEDRYAEISRLTRSNRIGMIAINSNEATRDRGDGLDDMVKRAQKMGYDFNYVLDKNHVVADAFGATRTPHVFLFNGDLELIYTGAVDDNAFNSAAVKNHYLKDAINHMLKGEPITKPSTKSEGCSIKRVG